MSISYMIMQKRYRESVTRDQTYKAYKLTCLHELIAIETELAKPRLAAARKSEFEEQLKALKKSEVSHFDFLEEICGYHIIKVPRRAVAHLYTCSLHARGLAHALLAAFAL